MLSLIWWGIWVSAFLSLSVVRSIDDDKGVERVALANWFDYVRQGCLSASASVLFQYWPFNHNIAQ